MNPDHLIHRFAYMKNEIPIAGVRPPGGNVPVRDRPGVLGARRQLQGPRARQPVRRRHQHLPEHRRREPGADGDGELAAGRGPPARAAGVSAGDGRIARRASRSRSRSATSGRWSSRWAAGSARTRPPGATSSTATGSTSSRRRGGVRCSCRGRTASRTGATSSTGGSHQLPLTEPEHSNAIHGLVRWAAWRIGEREAHRVVMEHVIHPQPGYPFTLGLGIEYALSEEGLSVTTTARNLGSDACPYGCGQHPYLTARNPDRGHDRAAGAGTAGARSPTSAISRPAPSPWTEPSTTSAPPDDRRDEARQRLHRSRA